MDALMHDNRVKAEAGASVISPGLVPVRGYVQQSVDHMLGYLGKARFAFFYYEPRGEEVVWNDGRSYGFGTGGWRAFLSEIVPLADHYGVDLGDVHARGKHVLLVDRQLRQAFFADRESAEAVVAQQQVSLAA